MTNDVTHSEAVEQALQLVSRGFGLPASAIDPDTKLVDLKDFDSLAMEEVLMEIETVIGKPVEPDLIAQMETARDIARVIEQNAQG